MTEPRSSTETIIYALYALARDIQSEDGIANAAIYEAAQRMGELLKERDQAVQSYAADRERFAAQEERHRVKITEQAERIRELVEALEPFATLKTPEKPENNAGFYSLFFSSITHAQSVFAKYGRAGE